MIKIILLFFVIVLFLAIFISDSITTKQKAIILSLILLVFGSAYLYETGLEKAEANNLKKIEAFKQGKTLTCKNNIQVDKKHFYFFSGTSTFSPKPNSNYVDMVISVDDCK